jgi:hypothetical protein
MADAASITMSVTILPDEIAKTITGLTAGHTPADEHENWYYKVTTCTTTVSQNLIVGSLLDEPAAVAAHDAVETTDEVRFLFVKNTDGSNPVYLHFNSLATADFATSAANALKIPAGSSWFGNFDNLTVDGLNARTTGGDVVCQVAAIIETAP